jgi:glycosyltransferase involved in cell wall biosynthesis
MHIGIFAERFVGRYGADRVGVIMAEILRQRGHRVTLVGVRFSEPVLERFPGQTVRVPDFSLKEPEPRTLRYFKETHYYRRRHLPEFDLCLVGSYPFITAIPYLREIAPKGVLFVDYGVVPTQGYHPRVVGMIEAVRADRRENLRHASRILAISDFIARDQSRPDCQDRVPVTTVLLGADHLVSRLGYTEGAGPARGVVPFEKSHTLRLLDRIRHEGRKPVLALGRWEPGCYKNSAAAYEVLRALLDYEPDAALLVMADPQTFHPDPALARNVYCIGLPSDADLLEVIRQIDAGLSVSLWEGFNLPLAELQYLGKPAFAFRLGAHPEVVVSPEQLCTGTGEMALKLYRTLEMDGRPAWGGSADWQAWKERFSWRRFIEEFSAIVERAA